MDYIYHLCQKLFGKNFEPRRISQYRYSFLSLSYLACIFYFIYICISVSKAPTVISQDEDLTHNDSSIPVVYISYGNPNQNYDPHLTVNCVFYYTDGTAEPSENCQPWLQNDTNNGVYDDGVYTGYIFKADENSIRFGSGTESSIRYVQKILFLIDYTSPPPSSDDSYSDYYTLFRGDFVLLNLVDPDYNLTSEPVNNMADQYSIMNENSVTLSHSEFVYATYSRTQLAALNGGNKLNNFRNRFGIFSRIVNETTLNVAWEYHRTANNLTASAVMLFPSTFAVIKQKETYTLTFISAIGSLNTVIGAFGFLGGIWFGSVKLKAFGYFHKSEPYKDQYKQLLYKGNDHVHMTFEEAVGLLDERKKIGMVDIERQGSIAKDSFVTTSSFTPPVGVSAAEIQLRILSNWLD